MHEYHDSTAVVVSVDHWVDQVSEPHTLLSVLINRRIETVIPVDWVDQIN